MYIVGVGPGAPDLLTLRAVEVLSKAEVVVYGNLVPDEIVQRYCRNAKEVIKVTKKHRKDAIRIVVEKALEGKIVAHLKNGDPTIFSSINEEVEELRRHGIPFEIVPGVSSVTAGLAELGLGLTDFTRGVRGFAVVNGHDESPEIIAELAEKLGLVVVLMPSLEKIERARQLIKREHCVVAISNVSLSSRKVYVNSLPQGYESPLIVYLITSPEVCKILCYQ